VYFGQTPVTGGTTLAAQCADPNIDIVILAFVISTSDGGQYPQVNFSAACGGQTVEITSQAPALLSCPKLATNITTCQSKYGKKVLLNMGGATSHFIPLSIISKHFRYYVVESF
jgi:chitinase